MKKILLATTMLVAGATVAAAEVTLSGSARMGIQDAFTGDVGFSSRARVVFTLSGETDSGLSFGASFRADNAGGANSGTDGSVFISGAFGKLSMGDLDSAAQGLVGQVDGVGYTNLSDLNEVTYIGTSDFTDAVYEYSAGAFTGALSVTQPSQATTKWSIAGKYATDAYSVALGYEDNDAGTEHLILGVTGTFSGITLKAIYGEASGAVEGSQYAVSATYKMDALSVTAYVADDSEILAGDEAYGIGASYDLGGGAALSAGYAKNQTDDTDGYEVGVTFSF